jgi:hypothetical protein
MRYKSWGLTESDLKEPYADIIPDRVKRLIDLHHKNLVEFSWDQESKNEQIFEYRRTLRPNTYSYNIESIYRIRDANDKSKEYYFYIKKGRVLNEKDGRSPEQIEQDIKENSDKFKTSTSSTRNEYIVKSELRFAR